MGFGGSIDLICIEFDKKDSKWGRKNLGFGQSMEFDFIVKLWAWGRKKMGSGFWICIKMIAIEVEESWVLNKVWIWIY